MVTNHAERQTQLDDPELYRSTALIERCEALGLDIKRLMFARILVGIGDLGG